MAERQQAQRKARAVKRPAKPAVDPKRQNAALKRGLAQALERQAATSEENTQLLAELREALDRQTATADVLKLISRSTFDLQPVLDTLVEAAARLCSAEQGIIWRRDGDVFSAAGSYGHSEEARSFLTESHPGPGRGTLVGRTLLEGRAVHILDARQDPEYTWSEAVERVGFRTMLGVPLLREGMPIGAFSLYRHKVRPFSDKQIDLVATFADQAVIAIENVRLLTETREALERETAMAEVLRVINSSPGDLAPVFNAILKNAHRLCAVTQGGLLLYDGGRFRAVATQGLSAAFADRLRQGYSPGPKHPSWRLLEGARFVQIPDLAGHDDPMAYAAFEISGVRTALFIPLRNDKTLLGQIVASRQEVKPFGEKEIALLEGFAAQAVIAIENARLFGELRERQAELARSVDDLTATGDVLKIISRSSVDLETVLDTLVDTVARLCRADQASMLRRHDDMFHLVASRGFSQEAEEFTLAHPFAPGRGSMSGRVELERRAVHIPDILQDPEYTAREFQKLAGCRTMLGIPLLREETLVGILVLLRTRVDPFTNREIDLATTFANQAMIAIENARLFDELRERQAELRVTFDNMGDGVAMFDAEARLAAWNRNFQEILDLPDAFLARRPSYTEYFRYLAERGEYSADLEAELNRGIADTSREMRLERTRPDGRVIEVRRNAVPGGGFVLIYSDVTERKHAEEAVRAARDAAETALRDLQTAQASLLHAQKMAALGQLTAGIAHEIKNPLNFVNNFAGLSVELLGELKEAAAQVIGALDAGRRAEIVETMGMLTGNLEKIAEHGRRADGIVRSMLQHSRGGSGDWQATDLNALVEEALNLAYHGARAQDQSFNIALERDLDRDLAPVDVVPQDMTRVFLNLIGNGFYAANRRKREADAAFRPVLHVATRDLGDTVEIRVRDNGIGIPREHRDRLFQPFFTTKPTGEGTGLGLSISYDIIAQQHGGTITVDSEVGAFTEFVVRLPRRGHVSTAGRTA
jgi:two-component system, NtrC family, sensor kinase